MGMTLENGVNPLVPRGAPHQSFVMFTPVTRHFAEAATVTIGVVTFY